jgi:multidrug efflux system membrane fusion protein
MLAVSIAGCKPPPASPTSTALPVVPVSRPVKRQVTDTVEYTGRTAAVQSLDVRARVSGYLVQMPFKEGSEVRGGEVLFEIDPRPYKAQLDVARAQVALGEANLNLARANNARARYTASKDPGSITAQELDQYQAQEEQAVANLKGPKPTCKLPNSTSTGLRSPRRLTARSADTT